MSTFASDLHRRNILKLLFEILRMSKTVIRPGFFIPLATAFFATQYDAHASNVGDPKSLGCDKDTVTLTSVSRSGSYQGWKGTLSVEMRWSNRCQIRWVKAFVPKDTQLYLKDSSGRKFVVYTTRVNGQSFSDAENSSGPFQACAKHPRVKKDWCTSAK